MAFSLSSLLSSSPRLSSSLLSSSPLLQRKLSTSSWLSSQKNCFENADNNSIWLRDEVLFAERRTALTPEHAKVLLDDGFQVNKKREKEEKWKNLKKKKKKKEKREKGKERKGMVVFPLFTERTPRDP